MDRASGQRTSSWVRYFGDVLLGRDHSADRDLLEGFHLPAGFGIPWHSQRRRLGEEEGLSFSTLAAASVIRPTEVS